MSNETKEKIFMKKTFALAAMMASITPNLASAAEMIQTKYACEGGRTLDVVYVGDYAVALQMDELVLLKRAKSASGVRYISTNKNYTYELWGKNNDMNLQPTMRKEASRSQ
ncbi:MliC family protein [Escherichia coli]|uniref:MliC family protein n=1 Tax=Escherichia coli TaxID=562 RepID=UPI0020198A38|nr:MliC family protein [Escherichia coli]